eukprot:1429590-Prymnesium_polylepis.1
MVSPGAVSGRYARPAVPLIVMDGISDGFGTLKAPTRANFRAEKSPTATFQGQGVCRTAVDVLTQMTHGGGSLPQRAGV